MTGSQYKNVAQWTLANLPPETAESPIATAKAILDHCAVAFPHGDNLEVLTTLMSNAYMGWESCTFAQAEEAANYGIAAVGMDTDHLVVILPEDTTGLTGVASQDATQNPIARQAADIPLSERLSMQFFAYTATTTSPVRIYLSPAYHLNDNPCSYSSSCSEVTHCNAYMDQLEAHLRASGFATKRGNRNGTGEPEGTYRINEANAWPAQFYYIAHTNASTNGQARGSRPMVRSYDQIGHTIASIILEERAKIYSFGSSSIKPNDGWVEMNKVNMPCVYEELIFHDNYEDAKFLHQNMDKMAEYTARALCRWFGRTYHTPTT